MERDKGAKAKGQALVNFLSFKLLFTPTWYEKHPFMILRSDSLYNVSWSSVCPSTLIWCIFRRLDLLPVFWLWMLLNVDSSLTLLSLPTQTSHQWDPRSFQILPPCYLSLVMWWGLQTSFWYWHGVPSVCHYCYGGCQRVCPVFPWSTLRNAMSTTPALLSLVIELINWRKKLRRAFSLR